MLLISLAVTAQPPLPPLELPPPPPRQAAALQARIREVTAVT